MHLFEFILLVPCYNPDGDIHFLHSFHGTILHHLYTYNDLMKRVVIIFLGDTLSGAPPSGIKRIGTCEGGSYFSPGSRVT